MRDLSNCPRVLRYAIALCFCAVATAGWAGPGNPARHWILSGSELVEALEGRSAGDVGEGEFRRALSSARANAYIAGVADATSGTRWCGAGTVLPHELADRVYSHLRSLGSERLTGSASTLVIEALAQAFPCAPR